MQGCHHFLYGTATSRVAAKIATSGAAHTFAGRRIYPRHETAFLGSYPTRVCVYSLIQPHYPLTFRAVIQAGENCKDTLNHKPV